MIPYQVFLSTNCCLNHCHFLSNSSQDFSVHYPFRWLEAKDRGSSTFEFGCQRPAVRLSTEADVIGSNGPFRVTFARPGGLVEMSSHVYNGPTSASSAVHIKRRTDPEFIKHACGMSSASITRLWVEISLHRSFFSKMASDLNMDGPSSTELDLTYGEPPPD